MRAMLIRELRIKGQATTDVKQGMTEASNTRDALAKFIYGNLFNWLVVKINRAMGVPPKGCKSIGILDIFGFEIFKENSFEQLCINFTNEMLQQHFNAHTFKLEEQVYKQEKVAFKHIDFIDNQPVLDLIEAKGKGILPILDEELVVPKGSDATFLAKLHNTHEKASAKYYKKVLKNPNQFMC
jgi:myosin heavy subunit